VGAIDDDFDQLPYVNNQFENDTNSRYDDGAMFSIVFIEDFFTDGRGFAYYVVGRPNITAFAQGIYGMQAYNGPLTATPMMSHGSEVLHAFQSLDRIGGKVQRSHSRMEEVKWKYIFETARLAWSKLRIDPQKLTRIRKRNHILLSREKRLSRDQGADWEVQSVTSTEAMEIDAGMTENKHGNRKPSSVGEPPTPATGPSDVTGEQHDALNERDFAEDCARIDFALSLVRKKGGNGDDFVNCLTNLTRDLKETEHVQTMCNSLIGQLKENLELAMELEEGKSNSIGPIAATLLSVEIGLKNNKEGLILELATLLRNHRDHKPTQLTQPSDLADSIAESPTDIQQVMTITGCNEKWSRDLLAQNLWQVELAVAAHLDSKDLAVDATPTKTQQDTNVSHTRVISWHGLPNDVYSSTSQWASKLEPTCARKPKHYPEAGPSGTKNLRKLSEAEEEMMLVADRERLARIILQSGESDNEGNG
jgi:hypothetical protein